MIKKIFNFVMNILFPSKCMFCGKTLPSDAKEDFLVCDKCVNQLPFRSKEEERPDAYFPLDRNESVFIYESRVKDAIHRFKFNGKKFYAKTFARFMFILISNRYIPSDIDCIFPVPLGPKRLLERGYNQAGELAFYISKQSQIPVCDKCLLRVKESVSQTALTSRERQKNIEGAFAANPDFDVRGKTVLLTDDVFTTGATLRECAKMLKEAGAKTVYSVTIAATQL